MNRSLFLGLLLPLALAAIPAEARQKHHADGKAPQVEEKRFPTGVAWRLTEINGKPLRGDAPTLEVDDTYRASGFSGCNTYSSQLYPAQGMRLAMGPIAMTRKACPNGGLQLERMFLVTLHSGPNWDVDAGQTLLTVKGAGGTLKFRRGF
jgi:heat shock protein HslJ